MKRGVASILVVAVAFALGAEEGYTNVAGRVLVATPVGVEGGQVTFQKAAGACERYPLKIFPRGEQARIKAAVGIRELPDALQGVARVFRERREHAEARAQAGRLTPEKLDEKRALLAEAWRRAVEASALSDSEKAIWKGQCP